MSVAVLLTVTQQHLRSSITYLSIDHINFITMSVDALTRAIDKITDNFYRSENKAEVSAAYHRAQDMTIK